MDYYPRNRMGDTEPLNKTLLKTKHTKNSGIFYVVGLEPAITSYLAGWIKKTCNIPS